MGVNVQARNIRDRLVDLLQLIPHADLVSFVRITTDVRSTVVRSFGLLVRPANGQPRILVFQLYPLRL